jgi:hypothetical protein
VAFRNPMIGIACPLDPFADELVPRPSASEAPGKVDALIIPFNLAESTSATSGNAHQLTAHTPEYCSTVGRVSRMFQCFH